MKNIILTLIGIAISIGAYAKPFFINPGSPEGIFKQIFLDLGKDIEHNFIQASTPIAASQYLTKEKTLIFWSAEWPGNKNIKNINFNKENVAGLLITETLMCSREFTKLEDMKGKTIKIATWGSNAVKNYLSNLEEKLNTKFIIIPYDGSGSITKGYLGKDADTVFTTVSRKQALETDKNTKCFAFSENESLEFRFIDAIVALNGLDTLMIRNLLRIKSETEEWKIKLNGVRLILDGDLMMLYNKAVLNFTKN